MDPPGYRPTPSSAFPPRKSSWSPSTAPSALNALPSTAQYELESLFLWYDTTPSLRTDHSSPPRTGFGGLSRRRGKKPVIAAVNGLAFGGGMEIVANVDLVVAAENAVFALPEVRRGVGAMAGALPRLGRTVGRVRAMEMGLTGRGVGPEEGVRWGFVNEVVPAIEIAVQIAANSPDSVIVTRAGVVAAWEDGSAENASRMVQDNWADALNTGENLREGVRAFVEKREPRWVDSKL
ncbi:ClpP/crotonase [Aspergillus ellipticus CBS 707.79]|uniref:ClpP/crotonase n=1 Tax=Aspergillus ellipticus CBS 707.79 TaxID=1448320 RepID=A0A319DAX3_9EURO|nr:ClpP/crotonase [Aspergillus ellipticus CBS 707.79]